MQFKKVALITMAALSMGSAWVQASDSIQFNAQVDRNVIALDESVSLKITVLADGNAPEGDAPVFTAPDFELINEYSGTFVESTYTNGQFSVRNNLTFTKVLRPRKTGSLTISGIQAKIGGQVYRAPNLTVRVEAGGAGTPPPRNYGGGGAGLRGAGKRASTSPFFLRAEVDQERVYKGQQVIVSYYLYRRPRIFNPNVTKFPTLAGFLREELEMPILGSTRFESERVVLDGMTYDRVLLLRYAAYPLKDGKLTIDSLELRAQYYGSSSNLLEDEEDPFAQFFHQMTPRSSSARSEPLTLEVLPLPSDGRPQSFSGGVGDFQVEAVMDKAEAKANEAVNVTVKVEGRGNLSSIEAPQAKWPENIELYDTKGTAKSGKSGVGVKTFEYLLIPRQPGDYVIPPLEFSFFDPEKKSYVTKTTQAMNLKVTEGAPGSAPPIPRNKNQLKDPSSPTSSSSDTATSTESSEMRGFKAGAPARSVVLGQPFWRWMYWISGAVFLLFVSWVAWDALRRARKKNRRKQNALSGKLRAQESKSWRSLRDRAILAQSGRSPWMEVLDAYELLTGAVYDLIDQKYGIGARSLARIELGRALTQDHGLSPEIWKRIDSILEQAEMVRFASSAGAVSESKARADLSKWVDEGSALSEILLK